MFQRVPFLAAIVLGCCIFIDGQTVEPLPQWKSLRAGFDEVKFSMHQKEGEPMFPLFRDDVPLQVVHLDRYNQSFQLPVYMEVDTLYCPVKTVENSTVMAVSYEAEIQSTVEGFSIDVHNINPAEGTKMESAGHLIGANLSVSYSKLHELYRNDVGGSTRNQISWCSFRAGLKPPMLMDLHDYIDADAVEMVQGLPPNLNSSLALIEYGEFVSSYGCHYFDVVEMGGSYTVHATANSTAVKEHSVTDLSVQFSLNFIYYAFDFGGFGYLNKSDIKIANWFLQANHSFVEFIGGDNTVQNNLTQWQASITASPDVLQFSLYPNYLLFINKAPKQSDAIKAFCGYYGEHGEYPTKPMSETIQSLYGKLHEARNKERKSDRQPPPRSHIRSNPKS